MLKGQSLQKSLDSIVFIINTTEENKPNINDIIEMMDLAKNGKKPSLVLLEKLDDILTALEK